MLRVPQSLFLIRSVAQRHLSSLNDFATVDPAALSGSSPYQVQNLGTSSVFFCVI